jgi:T-complex protein 1 subunit epsilon
MEQMDVEH